MSARAIGLRLSTIPLLLHLAGCGTPGGTKAAPPVEPPPGEVPPDEEPPAEEPPQCATPEAFDSAVRTLEQEAQAIVDAGAPGVAIAFADRCEVRAKGFGVRSVQTLLPVEPDTSFGVGSISKVVTAVAAHKLVEHGQLDLAARLQSIVPDVPIANAAEIRVADVLDHSSGIPSYLGWYPDGEIPTGSLRNALTQIPPVSAWAAPGEVHLYTNPGYALLGLVVEQSGGQPFADVVHSRVAAPLGLRTFSFGKGASENTSSGHFPNAQGQLEAFDVDATASKFYEPHASAFSSAGDLVRFAQALMDGDFLLPASTHALFEPSVPKHEGRHHSMSQGLHLMAYGPHTVAFHTGSFAGFSAFLYMVPETQISAAILVNGPLHVDAEIAILRSFDDYLSQANAHQAPDAPTIVDLEGQYVSASLGTFEVRRGNAGLEMRFGPGSTIDLHHLAGDQYFFTATNAIPGLPDLYQGVGFTMVFAPDQDGRARYFVSRIGIGQRQ